MTYNQLKKTLTDLLQSHAIIKTVKNDPPKEWLQKDDQPVFPICCFTINSGTLNKGLEQVYNVQLFFLDKSGAEAEFESDVVSDQLQILIDVIELMRGTKRSYTIDDSIAYNTIRDKYEDYLAGVEATFNITTQGSFDGCVFPTN